jgi:hypothetical protein
MLFRQPGARRSAGRRRTAVTRMAGMVVGGRIVGKMEGSPEAT